MTRTWIPLRRPKLGALTLGLATILGSLAGSALPAAQAVSNPAMTLALWVPFSGPDGAVLRQIVDRFNATHHDVNIRLTIVPNGSYQQTVTTAFSAHRGPDILAADSVQLATFASSGALQPLDPAVTADAGVNAGDFPAFAWDAGTYGQNRYGIPISTLPAVLYYNKAVFKAAGLDPNTPPTTGVQFLADAKKITRGGAYGFVVPPSWPQPYIFPSILAQFGGTQVDSAGKTPTFNSAAGVAALSLMRDWIYKDKISPPNTTADYPTKALSTGKAGMIVDGVWQYTLLHQALGANLGWGVIPQWGPKKAAFFTLFYLSLHKGPTTTPQTTKGALTFIKYFLDAGVQWAQSGDLPAYRPVLRTKAFRSSSFEVTAVSMLPYGVTEPRIPNYYTVSGELYPQIDLVLLGKKGAKAGLDYAAAQTAKVLGSAGE